LLLDPARVRQIVVNLLGNAIKFTFTGSIQVITRASWQGSNEMALEISVIDTGIGIPYDKQKLIFQAFRQADGSTVRRFGGSGLGLAIVQKLCELMSADVRLQSAPNRGSTFTVSFKVPARTAAAIKRESTEPKTLPHGRVLVVE